jgi:hypothetical protein
MTTFKLNVNGKPLFRAFAGADADIGVADRHFRYWRSLFRPMLKFEPCHLTLG